MASNSERSSVSGQREAQKGGSARRAHRRQIAEIHGEGLVAHRVERRQGAPEVHVFDQAVGRQHELLAAIWRDHRGVVADAERDPRRQGRDPRLEPGDQRMFTEVRDRL